MRRLLPAALLACLVPVAAGCGGGGGGGASSGAHPKSEVTMSGLRFHPATLSIRVGQTVTWRNGDSVDHNVTATRGASFHSRAFGNGGGYRFTPTKPGVVDYVCTLHPGMKGALLVKPR